MNFDTSGAKFRIRIRSAVGVTVAGVDGDTEIDLDRDGLDADGRGLELPAALDADPLREVFGRPEAVGVVRCAPLVNFDNVHHSAVLRHMLPADALGRLHRTHAVHHDAPDLLKVGLREPGLRQDPIAQGIARYDQLAA